jgi:16S rRNA (guanine527-N7)-methyltransferase
VSAGNSIPSRLHSDLSADRAAALALVPVSRETAERLDSFVALLLKWQRSVNLISSATVPRLWTRHVADSLQLLELAPRAQVWVDLGSGGGFPGLALACALAEKPGSAVHLVESNMKKAAFLREASRATAAPAFVHATRAEDFANNFEGHLDIVTARAFAPLKLLIKQAFPLLGKSGVTGLFLKGQGAEFELREAAEVWDIDAMLVPSRTNRSGRIVVIRNLERGGGPP